MMFDKYFEDFEVGDKWRSRGRTITESDLVMFSAFSGDWYPLHTDKEYAEKNTPFKQRIAHGMLVMSVASGLIKMEPEIIVAFYGIDRVRFLRPTFIHDTIHVAFEVTDLQDKGNGTGVVTADQSVVNQHDQPVIVGQYKILVNQKNQN
jgi:acyl dehydratase